MPANPLSQYSSISPFLLGESERLTLVVLLQRMASNALDLFHLDDCVIAVLDETGMRLRPLAGAPDWSGEEICSTKLDLPQNPLDVFASGGKDLLWQVRTDALGRSTAHQRVLFGCPILLQERLAGVLLASSATPERLTPASRRGLVLLAEQVALALNQAAQAEQMQSAQRIKASFLSLVTHELRSPLNTINGYLDLLLEGIAGEISPQQEEFIRRARASSEHLYALLEDLLFTARADSGQLRLQRGPTDLVELIEAALEELEITARDQQVSLEADLVEDLPELWLDGVRVQQALRNLLINALHFTPAGGQVVVRTRLLSGVGTASPRAVEISISDTGIGIASEYQQQVFERFFQVPRPEGGRTSGQGLGLAIVKMIVELHGGQISLVSAPQQGSTFSFTLPC